MTAPLKIVVTGAAGKMGGRIADLADQDDQFVVYGLVEAPGSALMGCQLYDVTVADDLEKVARGADVILDFTAPAATLKHLAGARSLKIPVVVGTTGFTADGQRTIQNIARDLPVVLSPNMSLGVNVLLQLVQQAARCLRTGYDLEIVEAHHRLKRDAPSGTAMHLAQILAENTGRTYPRDVVCGREGDVGPRTDREIGIEVIRGGDIVGEHTVMFCGLGERLELKHVATSRDTFARGALRAAQWIAGRAPGLYHMGDVLLELISEPQKMVLK